MNLGQLLLRGTLGLTSPDPETHEVTVIFDTRDDAEELFDKLEEAAGHMDDNGLEVPLSEMLKAFELAGGYATGNTNTKKLQSRKEHALALVDWLLMESDRGVKLLELTNRVSDLEAEIDAYRKGGGIIIGPIK